ncbi:hypothetical protein [Streptomyces sp. HB2AG]|uniref:hypothetical protein n=1 Tax=Streptomyces sp. HB2AG TaxID=2983400 RepID=UPI0022AB4A3C|nr:hypothetical protein [Streptomyces sp. HB2AG]MCZ2527965.1 hypothetical protein [Streptomyces sp. HB2AG]
MGLRPAPLDHSPAQPGHRAAVCEVFLTDSASTSEREVLVAARLPRVHSHYSGHTATPAPNGCAPSWTR